jgi:glutamate N-acetyltransferase/amino-acid N-acetyltransferase
LSAPSISGVAVDADRVDVTVGGVPVCRRGRPLPEAMAAASRRMRATRVVVRLDLHLGRGRGRVITSDLSPAYVQFNSAYST